MTTECLSYAFCCKLWVESFPGLFLRQQIPEINFLTTVLPSAVARPELVNLVFMTGIGAGARGLANWKSFLFSWPTSRVVPGFRWSVSCPFWVKIGAAESALYVILISCDGLVNNWGAGANWGGADSLTGDVFVPTDTYCEGNRLCWAGSQVNNPSQTCEMKCYDFEILFLCHASLDWMKLNESQEQLKCNTVALIFGSDNDWNFKEIMKFLPLMAKTISQ